MQKLSFTESSLSLKDQEPPKNMRCKPFRAVADSIHPQCKNPSLSLKARNLHRIMRCKPFRAVADSIHP